MFKSKVYAKFPKTGLGNMLLVWGKAFAFALDNNLELIVGRWWGIRWGAWYRNEKNKRIYFGYFKENSVLEQLAFQLFSLTAKATIEPTEKIKGVEKRLFVFNKYDVEGDYFKRLKPYRNEIRAGLYNMLSPAMRVKLIQYKRPVIAVHVRRGDFKLGSTITPIEFFIDAINYVRAVTGQQLPVTVFSDGTVEELKELLTLENVQLTTPKPDIIDILLLGQSDICILSISSTFSFWGAFLSDGIVLKHPKEWHPEIRPKRINEDLFEGFFDSTTHDARLRMTLENFSHKLQLKAPTI